MSDCKQKPRENPTFRRTLGLQPPKSATAQKGAVPMSSQNLISATLDPAVKTAILTQLTTIKQQLDFHVTLTPEEIKALPKAGELLTPFVDKAYALATDHPEILPRNFKENEYKIDYDLETQLEPIVHALGELYEMASNTLLAVKSDLMVASLDVYGAAQGQVDKVPGINASVASMGEHFKRTRTTKVAPTQSVK